MPSFSPPCPIFLRCQGSCGEIWCLLPWCFLAPTRTLGLVSFSQSLGRHFVHRVTLDVGLSFRRGYLDALKACHSLQSFTLDGILPPRQFRNYFGSWELFTTSILSLPQQIQDIRIEFRIPKETLRVVTEDLENLFHQPRLDWDPIDETLIQFSALKSISIGLVPIRGLSEEVEENRARLSAEFEDNVKLKLHRAQARGIL